MLNFLPYDLFSNILINLNDDDIKNLRLSNKYIYYYIKDFQKHKYKCLWIKKRDPLYILFWKHEIFPYNIDINSLDNIDKILLEIKLQIYNINKISISLSSSLEKYKSLF